MVVTHSGTRELRTRSPNNVSVAALWALSLQSKPIMDYLDFIARYELGQIEEIGSRSNKTMNPTLDPHYPILLGVEGM